MRSRAVALIIAFSVLLGAGIASASNDEIDPRTDTLFSYGYDPEAQIFLAATHATETSLYDCTVNGTFSVTYEDAMDGATPVTGLADGEGPISFDATESGLAEGVVHADGSIRYSADGPCAISGSTIGAQGHINHGQFMKLFNASIDMSGRGCLNRYLAQSDLGKDDQQVRHQDFVTADPGITTGTVELSTVPASCEHGKKDKSGDDQAAGNQKEDKGRPDKPGKSDKAPGHNK